MADHDSGGFLGIRPFSWVLAAVIAFVLAVIGRRYHHEPLVFLGAVALLPIGGIVVGTVGWLVIDWFRQEHLERRRYERQCAGLCVICGYDLRTLEGRCPECGMPIWRNAIGSPGVSGRSPGTTNKPGD